MEGTRGGGTAELSNYNNVLNFIHEVENIKSVTIFFLLTFPLIHRFIIPETMWKG